MFSIFLHTVTTQRKDKSKANIFNWMWLDVPSHTQLFRDFPQVSFGHLKGEMRLRVVQNEIVISVHECLSSGFNDFKEKVLLT